MAKIQSNENTVKTSCPDDAIIRETFIGLKLADWFDECLRMFSVKGCIHFYFYFIVDWLDLPICVCSHKLLWVFPIF